jgi:ORF6N domain
MGELIAQEAFIASQIYLIRGQKVIFDSDLAQLYGVPTSRLNEQIKRNINRFPSDFMFQLTETEFKNLISQNAISSWGGRRKLPLVFTEHGALMAASVLNSQAAIDAGIFIVRAFVKMRQMLSTYQEF